MLAIDDEVAAVTDYDYLLVHLLERNPAYLQRALENKRMTILDNSIFELGVAYEPDRFREWVKRIRPTIAVIPDALNDAIKTITQMEEWLSHPDKPHTTEYMAVLQGRNFHELMACYDLFSARPDIDYIGISFDSSPFLEFNEGDGADASLMRGRIKFLDDLTNKGKKIPHKPIHLLGVALPQELKHYRDRYDPSIIYSVDSSSPVVHGYYGLRFANEGLEVKIKQKLDSLLEVPVSARQKFNIEHNIKWFKKFAHR